AADSDLDEALVDNLIVRRVDSNPAEVGQPHLAPRMALRFLVRPVDVAADVTRRYAEGAQHGEHEVSEILTNALGLAQHLVDRRAGERGVARVLEPTVYVVGDVEHEGAERP